MIHDVLNWQLSLMFPWELDLADVPRACVSLLVYLLYTPLLSIIATIHQFLFPGCRVVLLLVDLAPECRVCLFYHVLSVPN